MHNKQIKVNILNRFQKTPDKFINSTKFYVIIIIFFVIFVNAFWQTL